MGRSAQLAAGTAVALLVILLLSPARTRSSIRRRSICGTSRCIRGASPRLTLLDRHRRDAARRAVGGTLRCSRPGALAAAARHAAAARADAAASGWRRRSVAALVGAARHWPVPALGLLLSPRGCALAALVGPRLVELVSPRDRRGADPRAVPRVPAAGAAALSVDELLRRARDARADRDASTPSQAQNHVADAAGTAERGARTRSTRLPALPDLVSVDGAPTAPALRRRRARSCVWRQTALARERLTSAVELYDAQRHAGQPLRAELSRIHRRRSRRRAAPAASGTSSARRAVRLRGAAHAARRAQHLHGRRAGCDRQARSSCTCMFDYRTLPFITSQNPVLRGRSGRPEPQPREGTAGGDVEVAIYGWGLQPIYTSGRSPGRSPTRCSRALYDSREPFWTDADARRRDATTSTSRTTASASTRSAIRRSTLFDHLVHLAELTTLGGAAFVLVLIGTAHVHARRARSARASAARCCARSAPASTASCSSRSCSRRSSRC